MSDGDDKENAGLNGNSQELLEMIETKKIVVTQKDTGNMIHIETG